MPPPLFQFSYLRACDEHNDNDMYNGSIELNYWKILIIIEAVKWKSSMKTWIENMLGTGPYS